MLNASTGSFGPPPGMQDYSNIAGLNYAGAENAPSMKYGFSSNSQFAFSQPGYRAPSLGYHAPQYNIEDFGIEQTIKHSIIGAGKGYGYNALDYNAAKSEYKTLTIDSVKTSALIAGTTALSLGVGMKNPVAGLVLGAAAAALSPVGEMRQGNYEDTQFSNYISGNIIGKDGTMGLSGKKNSDIAKMMQRNASKDTFIELDELKTIAKTFKVSGGMDNVNGSEIKGTIKKLIKQTKEMADVFGSSDWAGLSKELASFQKLGFSATGRKKAMTRTKFASKVAGIDYEEAKDMIHGYIARGGRNSDARVSTNQAIEDLSSSNSLMHMKNLGSQFNDINVLRGTQIELRNTQDGISKGQTGLSRTQTNAMLILESRKTGKSLQETYEGYHSLDYDGKRKYISESQTNGALKGNSMLIYNEATAGAIVKGSKEIGTLDTKNMEYKSLVKTAVKRAQNQTGKKFVSPESIMNSIAQLAPENMSSNQLSLLGTMGENYVNNNFSFDFLDQGAITAKKMERKTVRANRLEKIRKKNTLFERGKRGFSGMYQSVSEYVGGYDMAENTIDEYKKSFSDSARGMSFKGYKELRKKQNLSRMSFVQDSIKKDSTGVKKIDDLFENLKANDVNNIALNSVSEGKTFEEFTKVNNLAKNKSNVDSSDYNMALEGASMLRKKRSMKMMNRDAEFSYFGDTGGMFKGDKAHTDGIEIRDSIKKQKGYGRYDGYISDTDALGDIVSETLASSIHEADDATRGAVREFVASSGKDVGYAPVLAAVSTNITDESLKQMNIAEKGSSTYSGIEISKLGDKFKNLSKDEKNKLYNKSKIKGIASFNEIRNLQRNDISFDIDKHTKLMKNMSNDQLQEVMDNGEGDYSDTAALILAARDDNNGSMLKARKRKDSKLDANYSVIMKKMKKMNFSSSEIADTLKKISSGDLVTDNDLKKDLKSKRSGLTEEEESSFSGMMIGVKEASDEDKKNAIDNIYKEGEGVQEDRAKYLAAQHKGISAKQVVAAQNLFSEGKAIKGNFMDGMTDANKDILRDLAKQSSGSLISSDVKSTLEMTSGEGQTEKLLALMEDNGKQSLEVLKEISGSLV